jgi:hypothetical protein
MQSTPGFTLQHLQYLVVDEADRLLRQAYQARGRVPRVRGAACTRCRQHADRCPWATPQDWLPLVLKAIAPGAAAKLPWGAHAAGLPLPSAASGALEISAQRRCRGGVQGDRAATPRTVKIIVSATLTRDPSKIGRLQLHSPVLLTSSEDDQRCVAARFACWRQRSSPLTSDDCQLLSQLPTGAAAAPMAGGGARGGEAAHAACAAAAARWPADNCLHWLGVFYHVRVGCSRNSLALG